MEELPSNFDIIVVGTGMPECIVAAAAARVGKSVLHLDRNGHYGGDWASFNFDQFLEWIEDQACDENHNVDSNIHSLPDVINEGEHLVHCSGLCKNISNIIQKSYVKEFPDPPVAAEDAVNSTVNNVAESPGDNLEESQPEDNPGPSSSSAGVESEENSPATLASEAPAITLSTPDETEENASASDTIDDQHSPADGVSTSPSTISIELVGQPNHPLQPIAIQNDWTVSAFRENRRKFNLDLSPKLLYSRGSLVELLISSNIARYAEFQSINRVLTYINGQLQQVPCSRADVFSTKNVTVVEKRMLMKLLTFCIKYDEQPEEYSGFEDRPFLEFLRSRKVTPNIEHYVMHAIAMVDESCNTLQGLKATQKFMQSLGRYGNSPFLWTCYGSAELPQCFCRLCAVFGGIYYLKRVAEAIVMSDRCCGIVSRGQRINCQWLIMESSYAPPEFLPQQIPQKISRAIFITDESLLPSERQQNTLLRLPPIAGIDSSVTVLEFGSKAYICPEDLFIVYMFGHSSSTSPEEDLKPAAELLFGFENSGDSASGGNNCKPNVLWCVYYNQNDTNTIDLNSNAPDGLLLTSSPDSELDYESAVKQAKELFERICPGEDFLPRAPDPEDIILDNHANPGEEGGKIENDVNNCEADGSSSNIVATEDSSIDVSNELPENSPET